MLRITVEIPERWDEVNNIFLNEKTQVLTLEHSLISISKWESKWCKPFLSKQDKTNEETLDYVKCMTITQNVDPDAYDYLSSENIKNIKDYIDAPMTATKFKEDKNGKSNKDIVTSELIYYWMIALNIPFECQKWPIQRLLTLIEVCNIKNSPTKKMSRNEIIRQYAAVNEARKKMLNTKG